MCVLACVIDFKQKNLEPEPGDRCTCKCQCVNACANVQCMHGMGASVLACHWTKSEGRWKLRHAW